MASERDKRRAGGQADPHARVKAPRKDRKVHRNLVALSSAAILGVYSAGYLKTKAAAERFSDEPVRHPTQLPTPSAERSASQSADAARTQARSSTQTAPTPATATALSGGAARVDPVPAKSTIETAAATWTEAKATSASNPVAHSAPTASHRDAPAAAETPAASATTSSATPSAPAPLPVETARQALSSLPAAALPATAASAALVSQYKDGTYTGWGTCRHGDIQARVVIQAGRIASATIAQCLTRYSCSWISPLPPQVVTRQSPETDYVSGATQSTNAFYYAVVEALTAAKNK
jgi:uncharacterized protein with FMN-binding domain